MSSNEEKMWGEKAAAADGGKGLALEEYDPDVDTDMNSLYVTLLEENQKNDVPSQKRLKRFIRAKRLNAENKRLKRFIRAKRLNAAGEAPERETKAPKLALGNESISMSVESLVAHIKKHQNLEDFSPVANRLHSDKDLAFLLHGREKAIETLKICFAKRSEAYGATPFPENRTDYPFPVFSGMKGLGKTRMLEEWESLFTEAKVPSPREAVIITYGNGHSVSSADLELPISASFSWRLLHRLFLYQNSKSTAVTWDSVNFLPKNAHELQLPTALNVIRYLVGKYRGYEKSNVVSFFIGVDEYQKIPTGEEYQKAKADLVRGEKEVGNQNEGGLSEDDLKTIREKSNLWTLIGLLMKSSTSGMQGIHIFPAFAGTEWGPLSIAGSSVADAERVTMSLLTPQQMENAVASNEMSAASLSNPTFRRELFFFGGIPRPSLELALDPRSFKRTWHNRIQKTWMDELTPTDLLKLVANCVSGLKIESESMKSGIKDRSWAALIDQGLCLLRQDKQVSVPYCVFRLASGLSPENLGSYPERCLVQNLNYLAERVDQGLYTDNPPWQSWEKFGACFFAMRVNSLQILGKQTASFKSLCVNAAINGCDHEVVLEPMEVYHIEELLSVDLPKKVSSNDTHMELDWVDGRTTSGVVIRYCLQNGVDGAGVDIFSALRMVDNKMLLYCDQRKRVANTLGAGSAAALIEKEKIMPKCLGEGAVYVLGLFSLMATFDDDATFLPLDSFVLSYKQHDHFYGSLSSHPAASPNIDVNYDNVSHLRLLKSVKHISEDIVNRRKMRKFADLHEFRAFCEQKGRRLSDDDAERCIVYSQP